jgi:hypothetical protein
MMNLMDIENLYIPGSVMESARYVIRHAQDVTLQDGIAPVLTRAIAQRLEKGIDTIETAFGSTNDLGRDINLIFFETAVNFCFWAETDADKWKVAYNDEWIGGWYGLARAFHKALQAGTPVYDSAWMAKLSIKQAQELFKGRNQIPLLEQRVNNLVESANFLLERYDGQAIKLLERHAFSAPEVVKEIVTALPSYRDGAVYNGRWVWILKRAQILLNDLSQLTAKYSDFHIGNTDKLTAFADYRLPQVLRHFGVMTYSDRLAAQVDSGTVLPSGSAAEVEIRAATIIACDQLQKVMLRPSADIDLGLWLLSQDLASELKPNHRTVGYFY